MTPAELAHCLLVENPRGLWSWELAEVLEVDEDQVNRIVCGARQLCDRGETIQAQCHVYRVGQLPVRCTKYKICPDWINQRRVQRDLFVERRTA